MELCLLMDSEFFRLCTVQGTFDSLLLHTVTALQHVAVGPTASDMWDSAAGASRWDTARTLGHLCRSSLVTATGPKT